jgi:hypothetical protein
VLSAIGRAWSRSVYLIRQGLVPEGFCYSLLDEMATDTHVVRDGKIVAQSFAGQIKPKR